MAIPTRTGDEIFAGTDPNDSTIYPGSGNGHYSIRRLYQTRYGVNSINHDNDWPNEYENYC